MTDRDERLRVRDLVDDDPRQAPPASDGPRPDSPTRDGSPPAADGAAAPTVPQVVVDTGGARDDEDRGSPLPIDPRVVVIGLRRRLPMMVAVFLVVALLGLPAALAVRSQTWRVWTTILRKSEQREFLVTGNQPVVTLQTYSMPTLLRLVKVSENLESVMAEVGLKGADPAEVSAAIQVANPKDTQIIEIIFEWQDPQIAVALTNGLARAFVNSVDRLQKSEAIEGFDYLSGELTAVRTRIAELEEALVAFKTDHEVVKLTDQAGLLLQQVAEFDVLAQQAALDASLAERAVEATRSELELADPTVVSATFVTKPLHSRLVALEAELAGLLAVYTERAPEVMEARDELDRLRELIRRDLEEDLTEHTVSRNPVVSALEQTLVDQRLDATSHRARAEGYRIMLEQFRARLQELPELESRYADLSQRLQTLRDVESILARRVEEARIIRDSTASNLSIMQEARLPRWPLPSKAKLVLAGFILLGGAVAIGLGLGLEVVDTRLKALSEVEGALAIPTLGEIPQLAPEHVLLRGLEGHPAVEPYRELASSILLQRPHDHAGGWVLMVASADHYEGRTTVAANLARVAAGRGLRVCLVDAHLGKPDLSEMAVRLGQPGGGHGLAGILADGADVDAAIAGPDDAGIALLPSGDTSSLPVERLGTTAFARLTTELCRRFDLVLVDTAPVLTGSAAVLAAPATDAIIYLAESFALGRSGHREAVQRLGSTGTPILGAVLTKVQPAYARPFAAHRFARRGGRHAS